MTARSFALNLAALILAAASIHDPLGGPAYAQPATQPSADPRRARRTPVVTVFENCKDSVVNIASTQVIKVLSPMGGLEDLFDRMFDLPGHPGGIGPTREYRATSVGSGFVLHPSGYIVTNAHVVARTTDRKAIFADKREYDAQIVAMDTQRDLAVLKIDAEKPHPALRLGRSGDLMVGETVIAIGNPLGYQHTVTAGVVSAINRELQVNNNVVFDGLIQTDASINPGNSGGPLLNVLGELIGINTAIRGDAQNIGFAIPVDQLRELLPGMLDVERRYRIITGLRLGRDGSTKVTSVDKDGPAQQAGVDLSDVIKGVDGKPVGNAIDFYIALIGRKAGEKVQLDLVRGGATRSATLALAGRPKPNGAQLLTRHLGIEAEPLNDSAARKYGLRPGRGLIVVSVEDKGPAAQIGIARGDVIDQFAGYTLGTLDEAGAVLERIESGAKAPISILRAQGRMMYRAQATITLR